MLEPQKIDPPDNLSIQERRALKDLMSDDRIIIKMADKGGNLVIMDKKFYEEKLVMQNHLDTNAYQVIPSDSDDAVIDILQNHAKKCMICLTKSEYEYLTDYEWKSSQFYVLPKIHKCKSILDASTTSPSDIVDVPNPPDLSSRPIIAGCISPTHRLSNLIGKVLQPLLICQTSYIKDDWDFLRQLPSSIENDSDLITCDITSLYTSIPHDLGLQAVEYWIDREADRIPIRFTKVFIMESINILLTNNNFLFGLVMYTQLVGSAMGSIFSPPYACLTVGFLEEERLFKTVLPPLISINEMELVKKLYKRFMDDGITLLPKSLCKQQFLSCLNDLHPSIKFTIGNAKQVSDEYYMNAQVIEFLDISVILKDDNTIETDIYYKETNSHDYLNYDSFHPKTRKDNIPFTLAKRIIVFVSNPDKVVLRLAELQNWLRKCKFPETIIDKGFFNARLQGPAPKPIDKNDIVPFVTTHMSNYDCSHILKNTKAFINSHLNERVRTVFNDCKFVLGLKQPRNILRLVSHANFDSTGMLSTFEEPGLFTECSDPRCVLCKTYIQQCKSFYTANGVLWQIRCHMNCNSENVLYYLSCNMCNGATTYTGKTRTKFRLRLNGHISDCRTGNTTDKFDLHVHECGTKNGCLSPPFFKVYAFLKLKSPEKLISYEKTFHRRKYDTMN